MFKEARKQHDLMSSGSEGLLRVQDGQVSALNALCDSFYHFFRGLMQRESWDALGFADDQIKEVEKLELPTRKGPRVAGVRDI